MRPERNTICCEAMCIALSNDDLELRPTGPAICGQDAPAIHFCPFCAAQYASAAAGETWGWQLLRFDAGTEVVTAAATGQAHARLEYNTPY